MKKEFIVGNYERAAQAKTSWFGFRSSIELGYEERIESEDVIILDEHKFICTLITTEGHRILVWKESENPDGLTGDCNIYRDEYDDVYCYRTQKICEGTQMAFVAEVLTNLGLSGEIYDLDDDEATPEYKAYKNAWQSFLRILEQFVTGPSQSFQNTDNWIEGDDKEGFNATFIISPTHYTFVFNQEVFKGKYEWTEGFFKEWSIDTPFGRETFLYKTVFSSDKLPASFAKYCLEKISQKPETVVAKMQEKISILEDMINELKNELKNTLNLQK